MAFISEGKVKTMLLNQLEILGYTRLADSITGSDGSYSATIRIELRVSLIMRRYRHI